MDLDILDASYALATRKETGRVTSFCNWTKGADTLLARTGLACMVTPDAIGADQELKILAWSDVADVAADLMSEATEYSARYRVTDFPTADQLALVPAAEL